MRVAFILVASAWLAACMPAPSGNGSTGSAQAGYTVDGRIQGVYGPQEDVAWVLNPPHRPTIYVMGEQHVEFEASVAPPSVDSFALAVGARVVRRQVLPGTPDGAIPPKATNTYVLAFEPAAGELSGFKQLLADVGIVAPVFSSERAARIFYATLKARQAGAAHRVRFFGLNALGCVPEDCGIAPGDFLSANGGGGEVTPTSPPPSVPPERHFVTELADGKGQAYLLGRVLYSEAQGKAPEALLTLEDGASPEHIRLRMARQAKLIRVAAQRAYHRLG